MDIVQIVGNPRRVEQILHGAVAVVFTLHIHHVHSGTGCSVVYVAARKIQVMFRIATV